MLFTLDTRPLRGQTCNRPRLISSKSSALKKQAESEPEAGHRAGQDGATVQVMQRYKELVDITVSYRASNTNKLRTNADSLNATVEADRARRCTAPTKPSKWMRQQSRAPKYNSATATFTPSHRWPGGGNAWLI